MTGVSQSRIDTFKSKAMFTHRVKSFVHGAFFCFFDVRSKFCFKKQKSAQRTKFFTLLVNKLLVGRASRITNQEKKSKNHE